MHEDELSVSDKSETKRDYDYLFGKHMEDYNFEPTALQKKLQSKSEALRIMRRELEKFRMERDQFKLMAETLQLRYSATRRFSDFSGGDGSTVANLLHDTREKNIALTTEVEALKQKLCELQGDVQILRRKGTDFNCRRSCGDLSQKTPTKEEHLWKKERSMFICHLENLKKKNAQLAFDLKSLIDEKEELITERDAYKCKSHRLNHELISALKANESHPKFLDVDGIILENKYLHERIKNLETDLDLVTQHMNKYKSMLDAKRKKGIIKLGSNTNEESILSHKQAKAMLENGVDLPTKTETIQDLRSLCLALLDNLNDKTIALNHQKKTNRMLGSKIADLEQRIQTLAGLDLTSSGYSPALLLLNGYSAADVDSNESETTTETKKEIPKLLRKNERREESDVVVPSTTEVESNNNSDDGMSSFTSESGQSVVSSVYDVDIGMDELTKAEISNYSKNKNKTEAPSTADSGHCPSSTLFTTTRTNTSTPSKPCRYLTTELAQQRSNDLQRLPPDLAEIVQKTLDELDMRDFENEVIFNFHNKENDFIDSSYMEPLEEEAGGASGGVGATSFQ